MPYGIFLHSLNLITFKPTAKINSGFFDFSILKN